MRIWINDKQLDTYDGSVSVTKTNNIWKFGKAEFVHTQTMKLPATNNNKALLDFADEFRTQSAVARGFVDCLVDIDGVFEQGRLYVSGYSDGKFSVIITFGKELRSLDKKISEYIGDIVDFDTVVGLTNNFEELIMYDKDGNAIKRYCVAFNYILGKLKNAGVGNVDFDAISYNVAYAVDFNSSNILEVGSEKRVTLSRVYGTKSTSTTNKTPIFAYSFDYTFLNSYKSKTKYAILMSTEYSGASLYRSYYAPLEYYSFPFDIVLRFGSGCSDYAIGYIGSGNAYYDAFSSLRGHYMNDGWVEVSEDLSNTDITIPANTKFILLQYNDFYDGIITHPEIPGAFLNVQGLYYADYGGLANIFNNISVLLPVFRYNFIPDITVYQLLQTLAAYNQKLLYFDGSKYTLASISDIKNGIERTCEITTGYEVSDKAFDFAQHNIVKYDSGNNGLDYIVNNVHLSDEKEILTIHFDCGNLVVGASTIFRLADEFPAIGRIFANTFRFSHISKIPNFEELLDTTRQVKIKFRMTYLDFYDVKELDCFRYKGALLQWVNLTWSDGWCTATLQTV